MSSTQITGGLVSVEDGTKAAVEYQPPRKVRVELSFSVAEGDDATSTLTYVSDVARRQVDELLGRLTAGTPAAALAVGEPQKRTRGPNKTPASPPTSDASPAAAPEVPTQPAEGSASPAGAPQTSDAGAEQTSGDEWGADAAEATITDAELNAACSTTAERVGNPTLVRDAIQSFNTKPAGEKFKVTEIPQNLRASFLQKLTDLKKA